MVSEKIMWHLHFVMIVFITVIVSGKAQKAKTSKACFGAAGLQCTQNNCNCDAAKIAIKRAYFTENDECTVNGLSNCLTRVNGIKEKREYQQFNTAELKTLYGNCSSQHFCSYPAGRRTAQIAFSVIHYECIEDKITLDMCQKRGYIGKRFTIAFKTSTSRKCSCKINRANDKAAKITVNALHVELGNLDECSTMTLRTESESPVIKRNCSYNIIPYDTLVKEKSSVKVELTTVSRRQPGQTFVWLLISGNQDMNVSCSAEETNQPTFETSSNGGIVIGVLTGVLVLVVGTVILVWIIRRRKQKPESNQGVVGAKSDGDYSLATQFQGHYHEINDLKSTDSGYDYATATNSVEEHSKDSQTRRPRETRVGHVENDDEDYDHINKNLIHSSCGDDYDTTISAARAVEAITSRTEENEEYSYDHVKEDPGNNGATDGGYDTAASASDDVQKFRNMESPNVDFYGYNHLDNNTNPNIKDDYDTTGTTSYVVTEE